MNIIGCLKSADGQVEVAATDVEVWVEQLMMKHKLDVKPNQKLKESEYHTSIHQVTRNMTSNDH